MFFLAYIMIGDSPIERLNRGCLPVTWLGRTVTAIASLGSPGAEQKTKDSVQQTFYTCRFVLYRQFYKDDYDQLIQQQAEAPAPPQPVQQSPDGAAQ